MIKADLVLRGASEIRTCDGTVGEGPSGLVEKAALAMEKGDVVWVGPEKNLKREVEPLRDATEIDVAGRAVVPGFVDSHTHMVFAGSRAEEFAARAAGQRYEAGGILKTVAATRAASKEDLLTLTSDRATTMMRHGTTTAEAKSGYALDLEGETLLLEVLQEIHREHPLDLEITFCGAHALPEEYAGKPDEFIDRVCEMTSTVAPMARWCDVFCDEGAFTVEQSRRALEAGSAARLELRIHANELAPSGGAGLAAELKCASADHLIHLSEVEARALAEAGCVAVLCPVTALGLERFPDVALMREHGLPFAIASDLNPGSAYGESVQFAVAIATRTMGVGPEEALLAITRTAAQSLRRDDIGRLAPGCRGDAVVLACTTALELGYHAGINLIETIIKRGSVYTD